MTMSQKKINILQFAKMEKKRDSAKEWGLGQGNSLLQYYLQKKSFDFKNIIGVGEENGDDELSKQKYAS